MAHDELRRRLQRAVGLFQASPVGEQLRDVEQQRGRCKRASSRFISALREVGLRGNVLEWAGDGWWHHAVIVEGSDIVVDWTAAQLEHDPDTAQAVAWPLIETRAEAEARLGKAREVDPEDRADQFFRSV